jgi:hypothetical protein
MIAGMGDGELERVIGEELALLRPEVRAAHDRLEALLDDDFVEIGASGRRWERDAIIAVATKFVVARERRALEVHFSPGHRGAIR